MSILDKWHFTKELLARTPDTNRRIIYRKDRPTWIFNADRRPWEVWQDEALQRVCDELNKVERLE